MQERDPSPTPGPPAQVSIARKTSLHNFWPYVPVEIEAVGDTNCWNPSYKAHAQTYLDSLPLSSSAGVAD